MENLAVEKYTLTNLLLLNKVILIKVLYAIVVLLIVDFGERVDYVNQY